MIPKSQIPDEPTAGLDPNERMREYKNPQTFKISEIAEDKIVLKIQPTLCRIVEFIAKEIILLKSGKVVSHDACNNLIKRD